MTRYNGNIRNLLQGVSQQPRRDRRPEQLSKQENCFSSITLGLGRRPGTTRTAADFDIPGFSTGSKHTYDRGDGDERYTVVLTDTGLFVLDLHTGVSQTVTIDDNVDLTTGTPTYLLNAIPGDTRTPSEYLSFFTIADTTFVVNKTVTPEMYQTTDDPGWQACIYLASTKYGVVYKIIDEDAVTSTNDGIISSVETDAEILVTSGYASKTSGYRTSEVMTSLIGDTPPPPGTHLAGTGGFTPASAYTFYLVGDDTGWVPAVSDYFYASACYGSPTELIQITGLSAGIYTTDKPRVSSGEFVMTESEAFPGATIGSLIEWAEDNGVQHYTAVDSTVIILQSTDKYSLEVSDDAGGNDLRIIGTEYGQYDKLPARCLGGYKVKITGEDAEVDNDYYVEFVRDDGGTGVGRGVWKETVGFEQDIAIDPKLVPHKITRLSNGTFHLAQNEWVDRVCGDDDSNPDPSFIGTPIQTMGLYMDRFVFLTGENCVASQTYDHLNMFSKSVITISPTDPIDTASSDSQITNLEHLLVFDASLMIFSDKAQFIHSSDKAFTSELFALSSKSRYSTDTKTVPVASATSVFFAHKFGEFTGIREYKVDPLTGISSADPITHHVQKYITGRCKQVVSSTDYNILLSRADGDAKAVYVYEWFDQDNTRKQAAWHKWLFTYDILHMDIVQDTLYLWYSLDGDDVTYMTLDLANVETSSLAFPLCLDNITETLAVDEDATYWRIDRTLASLNTDSWGDVIFVGGTNSGVEGAKVAWEPLGDDSGVRVKKTDISNPTGTPKFYSGLKYVSSVEITNPYVRDSGGNPKTHAKTALKTMKFNCTDVGHIAIRVDKDHALTYTKEYNSKIIGSSEYLLNSHAPLQDAEIKVPIRTDANRCTITAESDSHFPFYIGDIDWSCNYNEKGRRTI